MKVKICGITNIDDALVCTRHGADAIGFIFYEGSKRYVTVGQAREIIKELPPFVMKVGVFVNEEAETVNKTAADVKLNAVQLHGDEEPEYLSKINYPTIKAIRIANADDMAELDKYKGCSFLLDTYDEEEYGGTGKSFDWTMIPSPLLDKIILAGDISSENIGRVYSEVKPYAVDLSSSLESKQGKKDHQKVKEFFQTLNRLRNE